MRHVPWECKRDCLLQISERWGSGNAIDSCCHLVTHRPDWWVSWDQWLKLLGTAIQIAPRIEDIAGMLSYVVDAADPDPRHKKYAHRVKVMNKLKRLMDNDKSELWDLACSAYKVLMNTYYYNPNINEPETYEQAYRVFAKLSQYAILDIDSEIQTEYSKKRDEWPLDSMTEMEIARVTIDSLIKNNYKIQWIQKEADKLGKWFVNQVGRNHHTISTSYPIESHYRHRLHQWTLFYFYQYPL